MKQHEEKRTIKAAVAYPASDSGLLARELLAAMPPEYYGNKVEFSSKSCPFTGTFWRCSATFRVHDLPVVMNIIAEDEDACAFNRGKQGTPLGVGSWVLVTLTDANEEPGRAYLADFSIRTGGFLYEENGVITPQEASPFSGVAHLKHAVMRRIGFNNAQALMNSYISFEDIPDSPGESALPGAGM